MPKAEVPRSSLRVQTVAHGFTRSTLFRYAEALAQSLANARSSEVIGDTIVALGDASAKAALDERSLEALRSTFADGGAEFAYDRFGQNLGHAAGHNRLFQENSSELLLLCNDDVVTGPEAVTELVRGLLLRPEVGLVEAHQLPFEHPKQYDLVTGETGWCSLACALTPADVFEKLGGLDAEWFFLHGDDVDYSWRLRLWDYKCTYRPSARVVHDKRVDATGAILISPKKERDLAEADLLLSRKYGEARRFDDVIAWYGEYGTDAQAKAAEAFSERREQGRLPSPMAGAERVAFFRDGGYAVHRFGLSFSS